MRSKPGRKVGPDGQPAWIDEPEIRLDTHAKLQNPPAVGTSTGLPRRGPRRFVPPLILVAVLLIAGFVVSRQRHRIAPPKPAPSPTVSQQPPIGTDRAFAEAQTGLFADIALGASALYVLSQAPALLVLIPRTAAVHNRATSVGLPADAKLLAVDKDERRLWVIGSGESSSAQAYDALTLTPVGKPVKVGVPVNQVAAANNTLWMTTPAGLLYIRGMSAPKVVAGVTGPTSAVNVDPTSGRIVAAVSTFAGEDVVIVDPYFARVLSKGHLPLVDVSLAATKNGIWYAGYGDPGGYGRVGKFTEGTLLQGLDLTSELNVGPGAVVWAGASVIWVSSGGDRKTSCIADSDGKIFARWPDLDGRVVSDGGFIAGIGSNSVRAMSQSGGCNG